MTGVYVRFFRFQILTLYLIVCEIHKRIKISLCVVFLRFWPFRGHVFSRILIVPPDFHLSDPSIAYHIYCGKYAFAGDVVDSGGASPFRLPFANLQWAKELHSFGWLRHLCVAGTDLSSANARALVLDWIDLHGSAGHRQVWKPCVTARRFISWLKCSSFLIHHSEASFHPVFLKSLSFHFRYLGAMSFAISSGIECLYIRIALALGCLALFSHRDTLSHALHDLSEELDRQISREGCHISRNPAFLRDILSDLLSLKHACISCGKLPPPRLLAVIERMFSSLRFFQHSDGSLARFNGMSATSHEYISLFLDQDEVASARLFHASHSGYERFMMGSTVVIADAGMPPVPEFSGVAHAGCLAFELSSRGQNFIINCGVDSGGSAESHLLARATAAHSTATLNDTSQGQFIYSAWIHWLIEDPLLRAANRVISRRTDGPESQSLVARHNAYVLRYGIWHEREMHLSEGGNLFSGVDRFFPDSCARIWHGVGDEIAIRFHIHPDIELRRESYNRFVLISRSGENWTFMAPDSSVTIEESIFFASPNGPRRTVQIVLFAKISEYPVIQWKMERDRL